MDLVVVGSCMIDIISYVERLPRPGETLHGSQVEIGFGGKGANQCITAARLGSKCAMVAKVGKDNFGDDYLKNFEENGVDIDHVRQTSEARSGIATISVETSGQNSIVIVGGANNLLTSEDVFGATDLITNARVLLCQLEVPPEVTLQALKLARRSNVFSILNPAPSIANLDRELFLNCDLCCPNETEAELLTGLEVKTPAAACIAAEALHKLGTPYVIITLGEQGALLSCSTDGKVTTHHVMAEKVQAIDSTGAGDAFLGSLGHFLSTSATLNSDVLLRCVKRACAVASHSVQAKGTQTSFPRRAELPSSLFDI